MARQRQRRRTKADWLEAGLEALESRGAEGVRVERLARTLKVAKSGFYWHFRDRAHLLEEMLDFWTHEYTEIVTANPELTALPPEKRLLAATNMIAEHDLARYDLPFRAWAQVDSAVLARVMGVYEARLRWLRRIFRELGFSGDELEMRTRLFVCYHTWEPTMFTGQSKQRTRRLNRRRVALLLRK
jgi:AcrR family transcriptional regulator